MSFHEVKSKKNSWKKNILISSGCNKSHIIALAGKLSKNSNHEVNFISSLYPKRKLKKLLTIFKLNSKAINRFLDREETLIDENIFSHLITEILNQFALFLRRNGFLNLHDKVDGLGCVLYSKFCTKLVKKIRPDIYHYRCCYGLSSADYSISNKFISICDHTIAHPRFIYSQIYNDKSFINPFKERRITDKEAKKMPKMLKLMEADLNKAENILVNSDFVKKTCVFYGINESKIKVIYLGCDDKFLSYEPKFIKSRNAINNLLFVGDWSIRKGVIQLSQSLMQIDQEINLTIVGASLNDIKRITPELLDSKVNLSILGYLSRKELATIYSQHKIFIVPSLCEGSARVAFEAMASGCYVIATDFAGTIIKDKENGALVEAFNNYQLKETILNSFLIPEKILSEIMELNFNYVRSNFTHSDYIVKLNNYYECLYYKF